MISNRYRLYSLCFNYEGARCGAAGPHENEDGSTSQPSLDLIQAEKTVESVLSAMGFKWKHEYSWPDGSLYKLILAPYVATAEMMKTGINAGLSGTRVNLLACTLLTRYQRVLDAVVGWNRWNRWHETLPIHFEEIEHEEEVKDAKNPGT